MSTNKDDFMSSFNVGSTYKLRDLVDAFSKRFIVKPTRGGHIDIDANVCVTNVYRSPL